MRLRLNGFGQSMSTGQVLHSLARLQPVVGRQTKLFPVVVVLGLLAAALEGLGIGLIVPMLGIIMGTDVASAQASSLVGFLRSFAEGLEGQSRLIAIALIIFALIAMKNIIGFANNVLSAYIYGKSGYAIRSALANRLLTVGFPFFSQTEPGRLLNVISNESWRATDAVSAILSIVINACAAVVLYAFLLMLSWPMTLALTAALALIQLGHAILVAKLKAPSRNVSNRNSALASRMLHLVSAGQLVRIFNQEDREQKRFDDASERLRKSAFMLHWRTAALAPLTEVLYAGLFLATVVGAWWTRTEFTLIVAFLILLYRLQPYVRGLQQGFTQLQSWTGALEDVAWLLDPEGKPAAPIGRASPAPLREAIQFEGVSFGYPGARSSVQILDNVSFRIARGRATALVGRSGAGKTTVVNLLCRLIEPSQGVIRIDDVALSTLEPAEWRARLAVASQDLELVDATVFENISYGAPGATAAQVRIAARLAEAAGFIEALPQGYETLVGHRGATLSAGQRQRIALARALLRDPEVLILDEATNAVDGLSEAIIRTAISARRGRGTTIVISHHHNTISSCDDVIVLRDGRVAVEAALSSVAGLAMEELYEHGFPEAPYETAP